MAQAVTVVRLPWDGRQQTVSRVLTVVAQEDLDLSQQLHGPATSQSVTFRPYSVVCYPGALHVCAFDNDVARALVRAPGSALVRRVLVDELLAPESLGPTVRLAFTTPTSFRVNGFDHLIPDPIHLFGGLLARWRAYGWPELPDPVLTRVPCWPECLAFDTHRKAGQPRRGFVGAARYEVVGQVDAGRAALWTLARFAEYAGVGQGTTYGMGRVRVLRGDGDRWSGGCQLSAWDSPEWSRRAPRS